MDSFIRNVFVDAKQPKEDVLDSVKILQVININLRPTEEQRFVKFYIIHLKSNNIECIMTTEVVKTRSGRISKPPVRYEPVEEVTDDYAEEDHDVEESEEEYEDESEEESESDDEEDDANENGNLKGFVVESDEESEEEA